MEEYKVMDYQKYSEYVERNGISEIGKYDELTDAVEVATKFEETPSKWGLPNGVRAEIIQLVVEDSLSHIGGKNIVPDGWIVVIHTPDNLSITTIKDPELEELEEVLKEAEKELNETNVTDASTLTNLNKSDVDKQVVNKKSSHSEQRNNDLTKLDIENDSFPHKKGRGNNPNSQKNLKPFKKGQSGNPGGKPVKFAQLKDVLDKYGDEGEFADLGWDTTTRRQRVIIGIWDRASKGNSADLDVLLKLGLLDSEKFEK
tara:strand:+ start:3725 stop:4498 length:774 start_codon:yes stop_codon:yes gene_type:complete